MKKVEKICKSAVHKIIRHEIDDWPPLCWGAFFQAERPQNACKKPNARREKRCSTLQK